MLALVAQNDKRYVTPVYAKRKSSAYDELIVLDADKTSIITINHGPHTDVFILDASGLDASEGEWQGLEWVVADGEFLRIIERNQEIGIEDYPRFKEYADSVVVPEWFEIKDFDGVSCLMDVASCFDHATVLTFDRNGNDIEMGIEGLDLYFIVRLVDVKDSSQIEKVGEILDADFDVGENEICWYINDAYLSDFVGTVDFSSTVNGNAYVRCRKVLWKICLDEKDMPESKEGYDGIERLYEDLQKNFPEAELRGEVIVLRNEKDTLEIEYGSEGFLTYINGLRKKSFGESNEIYFYAYEFMSAYGRENKKENILREIKPNKAEYLLKNIWYRVLGVLAVFAITLITAITGYFSWLGFGILSGVALIIFFFTLLTLLSSSDLTYEIYDSYMCVVKKDKRTVISFADIVSVEVIRSVFNKNNGIICLGIKTGCTVTHSRTLPIKYVDSVSELIRTLTYKNSDL